MKSHSSWLGTSQGRKRKRSPDLRSRLTVTALERRDNPSIPAGLLDVPLLYWNAGSTSGYTETHNVNKSFAHTVTLVQFGSGTEGTFVLEITGEAHATDEVSGSGGYVTATGTLTTDISYHIIVGGQYSSGAFTVTSQSYTETGSTALTYDMSVGGFWYPNPTPTHYNPYDGYSNHSWNVSWAGTVTDGALSFTSFSYGESFEEYWHRRNYYPGDVYVDDQVSTGFDWTTR
jgi:hypothetical protein